MIDQFTHQNRWWSDRGLIANDPHLRRMTNAAVQWTPDLPFRVDQDAVYVLRGPRQVGKSTVLKRFVAQLLGAGWDPLRILYLDVELAGLTTSTDLVAAIRAYLGTVRPTPATPQPRVAMLLDEVTRVANWAGAIRGLADNGELDDATVIATGSHTTDLRKGGERLPGRRGRGTDLDVQMHPLSFREYVQLLHPSVLLSSPVASLNRNDVAAGHLSRLGSRNSLVSILPRYLATGGFLSALNDQATTGSVQPDSYQKYREALVGEFTRAGLRESYLREVVIWMSSHLGKEFDSRGIAADTDIGSKDTARSYVQHLEDTYTINVAYRTNSLDKPAPNFRTPKKMHATDPLFFHMLRAWAAADPDPWVATHMTLSQPTEVGHLVESVVAVHLRRAFGDRVFYWRPDEKKEIDAVVDRPGVGQALAEIKYQGSVGRSDIGELLRRGGGIVLSRDTTEWIVPSLAYALPTAELLACLDAPSLAPPPA